MIYEGPMADSGEGETFDVFKLLWSNKVQLKVRFSSGCVYIIRFLLGRICGGTASVDLGCAHCA